MSNPGNIGDTLGLLTGVVETHTEPVKGNELSGLGGKPFVHLVDVQSGADESPNFSNNRHFFGQSLGFLAIFSMLLFGLFEIGEKLSVGDSPGYLVSDSFRKIQILIRIGFLLFRSECEGTDHSVSGNQGNEHRRTQTCPMHMSEGRE